MARLRSYNNRRRNKTEQEAQDAANLRWIMKYGRPFDIDTLEKLKALIEGVEPLGDDEDVGEFLIDQFADIFLTKWPEET